MPSPAPRNSKAVRAAIRLLVGLLGFDPKVGKDGGRLHAILGGDPTRKLRQWCDDSYEGRSGALVKGRSPRSSRDVADLFERLIEGAPENKRAEARQRLQDVCRLIDGGAQLIPRDNVDDVVGFLVMYLLAAREVSKVVHLDVVTQSRDVHGTMDACISPMVTQLVQLAKRGTSVSVRIIERGEQMTVQPNLGALPRGALALVCNAKQEEILSWDGSLISAVREDGVIVPVAAIVGAKGSYHVRVAADPDPNHEREIDEKLRDFARAWSHIHNAKPLRIWGRPSSDRPVFAS